MKKYFLQKLAATLAISFLTAPTLALAAQKKVALVIGNAEYGKDDLKNPLKDATDMKNGLEKAGFTVIFKTNVNREAMYDATDTFLDALDRDSLGLFYYSGHGAQIDGVNYLLPSGQIGDTKSKIKNNSYSINDLIGYLEEKGNKTNVVILDACRDSPSKGTRSIASKGLATVDATTTETGLLIAYATAPGKTASDNQRESNGLYTKYLKQYLFQPGVSITEALTDVSVAVRQEDSSQVPWMSMALTEKVCLAGCSVLPPTTPKTTYAPLLSFVSGANSITQNKSYAVKFTGTDSDGDLNKILIDWGDGTAITAKTAKNGTAVSFSHTYKFAGMFDLIATAVDKQNAESETYSKEVQVNEVVVSAPPVTPPIPVNVPSISTANASPSSIIKGNSIAFSASLSLALPSGYVVKVNYGNGFFSMNGSGTSFNLTAIPNNSAAYRVGVYDSAGVLKSNELTGNFEVTQPAPVNVAPTLSFISGNTSATTNAAYSVQLQAADSDNNLSSIAINWGDGASDSKAATNYTTLTFSHTYTSATSYNWSATASDSGSLKSNVISKNVAVSKPVVIAPPVVSSGTSSSSSAYTKVCNNGQLAGQGSCPIDPVLGSNAIQWGCTLDNKTQLVWEIKTTDGGLRDMSWMYSWYEPDASKNGGFAGYERNGQNTYAFTNAVNTQGLCGAKDWRLPSIDELKSIVKSSEWYLAIDTTYFPNTRSNSVWSSSSSDSSNAWSVDFLDGNDSSDGDKLARIDVRLVRNLSSSSSGTVVSNSTTSTTKGDVETFVSGDKTFRYTKIANDGSELPKTAKLGTNPTDWACTKDNNTGLIWEIKTTDGSLRDSAKSYDWDVSFNFPTFFNAQGLCGKKDWRLPTIQELSGLLVCSDGKYTIYGGNQYTDCTNFRNVDRPTINTTYFPDIKNDNSWFSSASSDYIDSENVVWGVDFYDGKTFNYGKDYLFGGVRLVR